MYIIFLYITLVTGIIPTSIYLIKKKDVYSNNSITPFLWLTCIASSYEIIGTLILKLNSKYWFQLYPLLSFLAIHYFFRKELSKYSLKIQFTIYLLFVICYIISFYYLNNDFFISSSINRLFISFYVFLFSIIWFKNKFEELNKKSLFEVNGLVNLWDRSSFYFITGLLLYYTVTFFLFISSSFLYNSDLYFNDYWFVNILATFILRVMLIVSAWKMSKV